MSCWHDGSPLTRQGGGSMGIHDTWRPARASTFNGGPYHGVPDPFLLGRGNSMQSQTRGPHYPNWETCVAAAALVNGHGSPEAIRRYAAGWSDVRPEQLEEVIRLREGFREGLSRHGWDMSAAVKDDVSEVSMPNSDDLSLSDIASVPSLDEFVAVIDTISPDGDESGCSGDAARLVAYMRLSMEERTPYESYMWDGQSFNAELPDRHILHDVAHWMVAAPERRCLPEFGLRSGPETDPSLTVHAILEQQEEKWEEVRAALLGILLQKALGMPCGLMAEEVALFNKGEPIRLEEDWFPAYTWLRKAGMVDDHGFPKVVSEMLSCASPRP